MNIVLDSNVLLQVMPYIVTEDSHFEEIKNLDFPKVDVINLIDFIKFLNHV